MEAAIIGAVCGIVGAILGAVVGGVFVLRGAQNQVAAVAAQTQGYVHERLYNQNLSLLTLLTQHPELRPYFYSGKKLEEATAEGATESQGVKTAARNQVEVVAELFAGFMELIALQLSELPGDVNQPGSVRAVWKQFVVDIHKTSPAIQTCIATHRDWYAKELHDVLPFPAAGRAATTGS